MVPREHMTTCGGIFAFPGWMCSWNLLIETRDSHEHLSCLGQFLTIRCYLIPNVSAANIVKPENENDGTVGRLSARRNG
jgi:hypothetical protein